MAVVKRIVCLANSRKRSGRCVAGKELGPSGFAGWVRPVSDRPFAEVSDYERMYRDGSDPRVLDLIEVSLKNHQPNRHQVENWLLDPYTRWARVGRISWKDLPALVDTPATLWLNSSSSHNGRQDRIGSPEARKQTNSLYFLRLSRLKLHVFPAGATLGKPQRRVQAVFSYAGVEYGFWVTDPYIESKYLASRDGEYQLDECFVTVSLGESFEGYCYKLVATIITPDRDVDRST
jgi:hypothetical protein